MKMLKTLAADSEIILSDFLKPDQYLLQYLIKVYVTLTTKSQFHMCCVLCSTHITLNTSFHSSDFFFYFLFKK